MRNQESNHSKKPDFAAYTVRETSEGNGRWNRIGAAWQHRDGKGYELSLDSLPVDGRITLRELREEKMKDYDTERRDYDSKPESTRQRGRGHGRER